ncbi:hypothetical protein FRB94_011307 [Tulasnella sp. JGI-2019a]|nr:hypothetical protein FRB94_011307 [Tulasnella sp. JGI-2019a]
MASLSIGYEKQHFTSATPQIYQSFTEPPGEEKSLTFIAPLDQKLMFQAKIPGDSAEVLVNGDYEINIHKALTNCDLALTVHGTKLIVSMPTTMIMEYFHPLSPDGRSPDWLMLHTIRSTRM